VLVAGSLPPLRESYQASGLQAFEEMQPQYHLLAGLLKPHCDLLLCETLATVTEGLAAASAASASGLPFWVSWTIEDSAGRSLLRSGEPLQASKRALASGLQQDCLQGSSSAQQQLTCAMPACMAACLQEAVAAVAELPGLEAVLVNCCSPQAVTAALPVLQAAAPPGVRIGGYANGFRVSTSGALSTVRQRGSEAGPWAF
jgi:S-methylmethionine-dependent homocysteine/selenocysteine methylase